MGMEAVGSKVWETPEVVASVVDRCGELPEALWQSTFRGEAKDWRYFQIAEETVREGFEYHYLLLRQKGGEGAVVVPFFVVDQDILGGTPGVIQQVADRVRRLAPRFLKLRILMVGCTAGEGALDPMEPWALEALHPALSHYARKVAKASLILFKDFPSSYRPMLAGLEKEGYFRAPSMPGAAMELDFASFDEFAQERLSKVYRKGLRRKFREAERHGPIELEVTHDVRHCIDEVHALYLQTHHRSPLKFEELTPGFFLRIGEQMPDRARFFLWRHEGKLIAFSLCLLHDGVLHDLNVGLDYRVALEMHLYFVTWRDVVCWALANGATHYYTGPLNYDPKLHLRLRLAPLDLYARHLSPWLNPVFGRALAYLQPARHDPVIARFPNADEL